MKRRRFIQQYTSGMFAGLTSLDGQPAKGKAETSLSGTAPSVLCKLFDAEGNPLPGEKLQRFHICDLLMRPFPIDPQFELGQVRFQPAARPFRISLPMIVPGFGEVFVYADNRGQGYTRQSLAKPEPLLLNREFAADRLATVRKLEQECSREGISVSPEVQRRAETAAGLLNKCTNAPGGPPEIARLSMESLRESLWAGELLVLDRARQRIERRGARPGFLFGCNAFQYPRYGQTYADRFTALFNFATLPFYRGSTEREEGARNYSRPAALLEWLGKTGIVCKGHPLIFLMGQPAWLHNRPFRETKRLCLDYVRQTILQFRGRIHVWDVINEAHVQPDGDYTKAAGFTKEQNVEMTAAACSAAHEADPTCFRVVNNTGTWADYYMGRKPAPWQQTVYDYLAMLRDAKVDYDAVGLQYYHSGRDLLEEERSIETFQNFGKPIHITEVEIPSSSDETGRGDWWAGGVGVARMAWHGSRHTEQTQADWAEQFYTICFSKPYIQALTWWDLCDPAFIRHGGLLNTDATPKESYRRLQLLLTKWRAMV
jgi:endo-1,4-beta-xylanase